MNFTGQVCVCQPQVQDSCQALATTDPYTVRETALPEQGIILLNKHNWKKFLAVREDNQNKNTRRTSKPLWHNIITLIPMVNLGRIQLEAMGVDEQHHPQRWCTYVGLPITTSGPLSNPQSPVQIPYSISSFPLFQSHTISFCCPGFSSSCFHLQVQVLPSSILLQKPHLWNWWDEQSGVGKAWDWPEIKTTYTR